MPPLRYIWEQQRQKETGIMKSLFAPWRMEFILNDSEPVMLIYSPEFFPLVEELRGKVPSIRKFICEWEGKGGSDPEYEGWVSNRSEEEPSPDSEVTLDDPEFIMYTSGTTGKPKGVVRTHENNLAQYVLNAMNTNIRPDDCVMLVMPMCHINSIYYSFTYTYCSARVFVYNMVSFDPVDLLKTIEKEKITFTSLVPTHYIMILSLPDAVKKSIDVGSMRQLLISSAPARKDTKLAIMEYFKDYAGLKINYVVQDRQLGTAHALLRAKKHIKDSFIVLSGDNIIDQNSISKLIRDKSKYSMLIKEHPHPSGERERCAHRGTVPPSCQDHPG
jgi:acyl-CoA synthetase (AMP-forming)/AMP-acid ligase II